MKLKRKEPGIYATDDGRVAIYRVISKQTNRTDEIVWQVYLDDKEVGFAHETLRDAKKYAMHKGLL